ncbi:MAG: hypothetical protein N2662_02505 [Bacteroidales bacterium]|nr:hypothetical protein [Bacteroidales bacterium]
MKKHFYYSLGVALMLAVLSLSSCKKDDNSPTDNTTTLAYTKEDDQVDSYFDEISSEADEIAFTATSKSMGKDSSIDQGSKGRRIRITQKTENGRIDTIIYENYVNGRSQFKRVKNGKIIIVQTGGPLQNTFNRTIHFQNFTINGNLIEGTKTITKTATYTYTITLENGKITFKDGTTDTRTFTRTRTWTAGYDTPFNIWDDEYTIEGTAEGTNRHGLKYTHRITSPLLIKISCPYIVAGSIELVVGANTITINYGDENSTCDGKVTVTINGISNQIQLNAEE